MMCKSLNFRSSKSDFSPQSVDSSLENLMTPLNNVEMIGYCFDCLCFATMSLMLGYNESAAPPVELNRKHLKLR